ncbi:MAG: hypothetical protein LBQ14_05135, partial [Treponema sp.]|nr:hypothetical protein [Treponema sp.]
MLSPGGEMKRRFFCLFLLPGAVLFLHAQNPRIITAVSIAMRGDPQYSGDFTHFGYVNPGAPKGGSITRYAIGTYDNFHR